MSEYFIRFADFVIDLVYNRDAFHLARHFYCELMC